MFGGDVSISLVRIRDDGRRATQGTAEHFSTSHADKRDAATDDMICPDRLSQQNDCLMAARMGNRYMKRRSGLARRMWTPRTQKNGRTTEANPPA